MYPINSPLSAPHTKASNPDLLAASFNSLISTLPSRELLRWTSSLLQGLGHMLLGISSTLRHVVEGADRWQWHGQRHLHS